MISAPFPFRHSQSVSYGVGGIFLHNGHLQRSAIVSMDKAIREFAKLMAEGARIREQRAEEERRADYQARVEELFSNHSTDDIKALWYQFEASEYVLDEVEGYLIYDIMAALNQRGEGDLCRY